ncbi:DUF4153 domain-containing protein [Parasporobacterium paucivorans]|uniref:DUF4153 domain-containing protein n=1 Tax=Parasporobacterium paucivorans DSM 15970 TaxID=1122934 RepID=A0A1M6JIQ0_9FIRM|nr:DUF4153 domain-containing protein [Parasporobacterium paucivorans]SHJ46550.1 protein of unknown function [Parasporobacterium paucivorans DSM 15970]
MIKDIDKLIDENTDNPHELERLYREEPRAFEESFPYIWEQNPDSRVLAAWNERLNFRGAGNTQKVSYLRKDILVMVLLAALSGISTRMILYLVDQQMIAPVNLVFGIFPFLAGLFVYKNLPKRTILTALVSLFLICGVYMNLLPFEGKDSILLAYLHLPVFLWVLTGLAFTGDNYRIGSTRLAYLKFNGEFCILYASMAICGMLLTALTMQLFGVVGVDISEFYFENIVLIGAAFLAVVAAFLASGNLKLARNIAPHIARIFGPLVLATLMVYLAAAIWIGKNPFLDRNFLLSFNGILLCVLAVTIFSITERSKEEKKNVSDFVNFALIVLALITDFVALSSIVFRLSSYGLTPNRLAVLGINILICIHLLWIIFAYMRFLQNKTDPAGIQDAITKYLPVYGIWTAFVTFAFPLIF